MQCLREVIYYDKIGCAFLIRRQVSYVNSNVEPGVLRSGKRHELLCWLGLTKFCLSKCETGINKLAVAVLAHVGTTMYVGVSCASGYVGPGNQLMSEVGK